MAKLVAIGDSLTQGFHSFAITNVDQSYPALIARALRLAPNEFRIPDFRGRGGLPCSLEWLARRLEERFGSQLSAFEWLRALHVIPDLLDEVEDYWERGQGSQVTADVRYHNLAVWGFEVADAFEINAAKCRERVGNPSDGFLALPSEPRLRTALRVLNPGRVEARWAETQISAARAIRDADGEIEHLIVWLGANNCLGTVIELEIRETDNVPPGPNSGKTLWTSQAFATNYLELAAQIDLIKAKHVYVATIPHVTIPPITRGVMKNRGRLPADEKYFDYYTRFFIRDENFDPQRDPHLTGADAKRIDETIDKYNASIRDAAAKRQNWHVVDIASVLDQLAVRRNHGKPTYSLPPAIADLNVRFFEPAPAGGLRAGGLISLDGVHPTPTGYAIVADEFLKAIAKNENTAARIDFAEVRRWDALVSRPPRTLDDIMSALQTLERFFHLSSWLRPRGWSD